MTAFSRATLVDSFGRCLIEISSVNRRHLEVQTFLPKELSSFEAEIRRRVQQKTARGAVTVKTTLRLTKELPIIASVNRALLTQLKPVIQEITQEFSLSETDFASAFLSRESNLILFDEDPSFGEKVAPIFFKTLDEALVGFQNSKEQEGVTLEKDLIQRIEKLKFNLELIAKNSEGIRLTLFEKIKNRIKDLLPEGLIHDERLLREACLLVDKADITEEIVRLTFHLDHFLKTMKEEAFQGKKLEFICQEIHREITTISSKTNETQVSLLCVDFKSELEKVKEQLQNIE